MPAGSERKSTGSPEDRSCTPWWIVGKKALPQSEAPPSGAAVPDTKTTKLGRSRFSVPSPYDSHEPMLGRPSRAEPVWTNNCAGAWLNWSVYIERTTAMSSATVARCGRMSDITWPDSPRGANRCGEPSSMGFPLRNANCCPRTYESGQAWPSSWLSRGLWSNMSSVDGAPAMCR